MTPAPLNIGFGTPWADQIDFLRQKLRLPTQRWDDIQRAAHDRAFIVAGAAKADLLADLQGAVTRAAEMGMGVAQFQREFLAVVAKHGWTGWTGEGSAAGEAWRARIIYQTNMASSYAAGRYRQFTAPDYLRLRPYWRYIHSESVAHPRPQHMAWHGLTLPHDHPFWQTHFAPNGWGCQCRITCVSRQEGEASARAGLGDPPAGWNQLDPKTGAPAGIDKGFDYAPGASVKQSFQRLIDDKLIRLNAPIGAAMWEALKPALLQERLAAWQPVFDAVRLNKQATGNATMVHTVPANTVAALAANAVTLENAAVWMRDTELMHALRDGKVLRGAALPDQVWRDLPLLLDSAVPYLDTQNNTLLYVVDLGANAGKVVVKINYNEKGRFDGVRQRIVSNFVVTGGALELGDLKAARYKPLTRQE
ncbi:MAG: phage head morphogenesis protein [Burkholderiaceae bacterium]|nr:phage head morphogenesis protein [Burkholderiaceae bacterium]MBY0454723.1 phage head morphogenesis protein [Burkholderiaceae bacterium]